MATYKMLTLICFKMLVTSNFLVLRIQVSLIRLERPKLGSLAHMLISNTKRNEITIILPFIVSHKLCMYKSMHGEHIFTFLTPTLLRFPLQK